MMALSSIPSNQATNTPTTSANEAQRYEENVPTMKHYLYREIKDIRKLESAATSLQEHSHALQRKIQLLSDFEAIRAFEQGLELSPSIIRFTFEVTTSIMLGVLLNINNSNTNLFASVGFFLQLISLIVWWIYSLTRYQKKISEILTHKAADREGVKARDGGRTIRTGKQAGSNVISSNETSLWVNQNRST